MSIFWKGTMSVMAIAICRAPAPPRSAQAAAPRVHSAHALSPCWASRWHLVQRHQAGMSTLPEAGHEMSRPGIEALQACTHRLARTLRSPQAAA